MKCSDCQKKLTHFFYLIGGMQLCKDCSLKLIIETLKTVLHEIYVEPQIKRERISLIAKMKEAVGGSRKDRKQEEASTAEPPK